MKNIYKDYDYEIFDQFSPEMSNNWENFEKESSSLVFQKFFFLNNWQNTINKKNNIKLFVIFIYKNKKLISILPLGIQSNFLFKFLVWLGEPFNDLNFPILRKNFDLNINELSYVIFLIFDRYKKHYSIIRLKKQIETFDKNKNPLVFKFKLVTKEKRSFIKFSSNKLAHYLEKIEFTKSKNYKRINKRINTINFKYISKNKNLENLELRKKIFEFVIKHKSLKMNKTKAWNYLNYSENYEFIKKNIENKNSTYSGLYLDDELISAHIGFEMDDIIYFIFPAYDERFKKLSPGTTTLFYLIKESISFNKKIIDMTIGNEDYKNYWQTNSEYLFESNFSYDFLTKFIIILIKLKNNLRYNKFFKILRGIYISFKK